jgi:hypothetical protein
MFRFLHTYPSSWLYLKHTTFRKLDSISVFRWNLLSWAQSIELVPISRKQQSQIKSQIYFTTGGLPPISSDRCQDHWDPRPETVFQLNHCGHSPYVTSSLTRRWVCFLWICLAFRQTHVSHIQHVIENSSFCTISKSSFSTGFGEQIISSLHIVCYNGSLFNWTAVSFTAAKVKPLIFSVSGFALSYTTTMFILMILYDFCLLPAQFCYVTVYMR